PRNPLAVEDSVLNADHLGYERAKRPCHGRPVRAEVAQSDSGGKHEPLWLVRKANAKERARVPAARRGGERLWLDVAGGKLPAGQIRERRGHRVRRKPLVNGPVRPRKADRGVALQRRGNVLTLEGLEPENDRPLRKPK